MVMGKLIGRCNVPALADPDLQIRGGGKGRSSRTSDKGGGAVFFGPSGHSLVQK